MKALEVVYRIECSAVEADSRARALAVEQSIEMPPEAVRSERVRAEFVGEVLDVQAAAPGVFRARIALAVDSTGCEAAQLLNMLFGNSSLLPDVVLEDFTLPHAALRAFGGPRDGIAGLRRRLGVDSGAITCSALKPLGSTPEALASLAGALVRGGVDVIKDDHGLAEQPTAPFARRVAVVQQAVDAANRERGTRCIYAPNLSGGPRRMLEQLRIVGELGVGMELIAPMITGIGLLQELAAAPEGPMLLAHPALAGAARIEPPTLIGRLFRLCGADATIFPNHGGRFSYSQQTCAQIAARAREPLSGLAPSMPVPAGGMRPERIAEMRSFYGEDVMFLIGGALLAAPEGVERAAAAFARAARGADR